MLWRRRTSLTAVLFNAKYDVLLYDLTSTYFESDPPPAQTEETLGAAKKESGRVWSLVDVQMPQPHQAVNSETFRFELNRGKFRRAIRREGRYLFRKFAPDQSSSVCSKRKGERAGTGYGLGVFKPLPVPGFRRSNETHSQQSPEFSLLSEWPKGGHDQLLLPP